MNKLKLKSIHTYFISFKLIFVRLHDKISFYVSNWHSKFIIEAKRFSKINFNEKLKREIIRVIILYLKIF